jgi:hypothetical protein
MVTISSTTGRKRGSSDSRVFNVFIVIKCLIKVLF